MKEKLISETDELIGQLNILKKALKGEEIDFDDDCAPEIFGAMDVYELIMDVQEHLSRMTHEVIRNHVSLLEAELVKKIKS